MSLAPGTALGPYEIVGLLGAGGMGEVFRARDSRLHREVAVKILPAHVADSPDRRARFERESRAVAALSHPNILAIFDVGVADSVTYAVTELLEGESLREHLANGRCQYANRSRSLCRPPGGCPRRTTKGSCIGI